MRRVVYACAALVVLTGCSRSPDPIEPAPNARPEPSAASSAGPTPPALPKIAERNDATGAASFAGYWIHVLNFAVAQQDPAPLHLVSSQDCQGCASYVRQIEEDKRGGIRSPGFKWTPESATFDGPTSVTVKVAAAGYQRLGPHTNQQVIRPSTYEVGFDLEWENGSWRVLEMYLP